MRYACNEICFGGTMVSGHRQQQRYNSPSACSNNSNIKAYYFQVASVEKKEQPLGILEIRVKHNIKRWEWRLERNGVK